MHYKKLSPEKSYILGVLCGDGHTSPCALRLEIRKDREFVGEFSNCLESVYGLKYKRRYYKLRNSLIVDVSSQIICGDLLRYSNFGVKNWEVLREIMESNDEKIAGCFTRGVFDSEGSVSKSTITISPICESGLEQVRLLLEDLGIKSLVRSVSGGRYCVLHIFRKQRFKILRDKVGFTIKRKEGKLNELLKNDRFYKEA